MSFKLLHLNALMKCIWCYSLLCPQAGKGEGLLPLYLFSIWRRAGDKGPSNGLKGKGSMMQSELVTHCTVLRDREKAGGGVGAGGRLNPFAAPTCNYIYIYIYVNNLPSTEQAVNTIPRQGKSFSFIFHRF